MISTKKAKFEGLIQPWGNSLGLRITRAMMDLTHLTRGSEVEIVITEQGMLVKPKVKIQKRRSLPFTEAELVRGMSPSKAHADALPALTQKELGE